MHKIVLIFFLLTGGGTLYAQYAGYTPLGNLENFKTGFTRASQKNQAIKSDFIQEKNLAMLSEKIVSKGNFWFKRDNRVRMEYRQPFQYLVIINNDKVFIKDGNKENRISTRSNKIFKQVNAIMIDCMQGTVFGNPDFKSKVYEGRLNYLVELVPVAKGLTDMFSNITVLVDKKDFSVNSIDMRERSGDNTLLHFVNKELNTKLPDALFIIN